MIHITHKILFTQYTCFILDSYDIYIYIHITSQSVSMVPSKDPVEKIFLERLMTHQLSPRENRGFTIESIVTCTHQQG